MDFVAFSNILSLTLWIAVYILCLLSFIIKRGKFAFSFGCGIFTVAAIVITLMSGAMLAEIGTELLLLVLLCLIARGYKR